MKIAFAFVQSFALACTVGWKIAFASSAATAPPAGPVVVLNRTVFEAASDVQIITANRLKGFAEASNIWSAVIKDGVVDTPELHFLQHILRGPGEIRLEAKQAPDWSPEDVIFGNYWRQERGVGGLPAPLDYLRRKIEMANLDITLANGVPQVVRRQ